MAIACAAEAMRSRYASLLQGARRLVAAEGMIEHIGFVVKATQMLQFEAQHYCAVGFDFAGAVGDEEI